MGLTLLTLSQLLRLTPLTLDGGYRRLGQHGGQPLNHSPVDDVRDIRGVNNQVARWGGAGQLQEPRPHLGVELVGLGLQPIMLVTASTAAGVGRDVQQHCQIRCEPLSGPARELSHLGDTQVTPGALVGHRRVAVPVGHDDRATVEGRAHHGVDVLGAVGGEQQRLSTRLERLACQQELAQPGAGGSRTRLVGEQRLVTLLGQPRPEHAYLGGLAPAVATLEGDEDARVPGPASRRVVQVPGTQRRGQVGAQREARAVVHLPVRRHADANGGQAGQQEGSHHPGIGQGKVLAQVQRVRQRQDLRQQRRDGRPQGQHADQHDAHHRDHEGECAPTHLVANLEAEQCVAGDPRRTGTGAQPDRDKHRQHHVGHQRQQHQPTTGRGNRQAEQPPAGELSEQPRATPHSQRQPDEDCGEQRSVPG